MQIMGYKVRYGLKFDELGCKYLGETKTMLEPREP